jgi:hypothetical protein
VTNNMIMFDSPEAATYRTNIEGWVDRNGLYHGNYERGARWSGCTHQTCACGNVHEKGLTVCNSCYAKERTEKYYALPLVEWDGGPLAVWDDDTFFWDEDSVLEYMSDQRSSENNGETPEIQLVTCKRGKLHLIDPEDWNDDLCEDGELPDEVLEKIEALNKAIAEAEIHTWWPDNKRVDPAQFWAQLEKEP